MNPETEFRDGLDDLAVHYKEVLKLLGEDPEREGLQKTPMRVSKAMQILTRGYTQDPHKVLTDAIFKEDYNQMVIVKDIDVFSLCEHHMLPFYGKAHIAYIPNGYITGLSKIARVVDIFSHRLQVQERLTQQIKDCIQETLKPQGVMVVIEAKHMCMQMRGVEKQNSNTKFMLFNINDLIEDLSTVFTLEAGDIIATGTPAGVGAGRDPQEWMYDGDVVEATVEGIGTIVNTIKEI